MNTTLLLLLTFFYELDSHSSTFFYIHKRQSVDPLLFTGCPKLLDIGMNTRSYTPIQSLLNKERGLPQNHPHKHLGNSHFSDPQIDTKSTRIIRAGRFWFFYSIPVKCLSSFISFHELWLVCELNYELLEGLFWTSVLIFYKRALFLRSSRQCNSYLKHATEC